MIVEAAVLVVGDDQQRLVPEWPIYQGTHHLPDQVLACRDVRRRMVVVARRHFDKVGVDERDRRQRSRLSCGENPWIIRSNVGDIEGVAFEQAQEAIAMLVVVPGDTLVGEMVEDGLGEDRNEIIDMRVVEFCAAIGIPIEPTRRCVETVGEGGPGCEQNQRWQMRNSLANASYTGTCVAW